MNIYYINDAEIPLLLHLIPAGHLLRFCHKTVTGAISVFLTMMAIPRRVNTTNNTIDYLRCLSLNKVSRK